ncbi:MAG: hypothetical protein B7C24_02570 [Bacteroidetes bacterium 4572_77]|nr:MAG: hypothetical protein B7C24_02570 [Bacteroidetes bacterium 4572_77]
MKNKTVFFVLSIILLQLMGCAQQKKTDITFKTDVYKFGSIQEEDAPVDLSFSFTNTGEEDLIIDQLKADVGIDNLKWPSAAIAPGESGLLEAKFNPKGSSGRVNKHITVYSNAKAATVVLRISGNIIPKPGSIAARYRKTFPNTDLRLATSYLNYGNIKNTEERTKELKIINTGNADMSLSFKGMPVFASAQAVPAVLKPNEEGLILVTFDGSKIADKEGKPVWGKQTNHFYLVINGEEDRSNRNLISIRSTIIEDFENLSEEELAIAPRIKFEEIVFDFDTIVKGDNVSHDFVYTNLGENDLEIRHVKAS